ncbi:Transformation system protein [hydrothermal vent metagenome]|uniref:Transformation system protein n=1 Tax=hydrothermal vent metagenome TaxID=652676 RepID=A0A1W1EK79_9ZZZZ
MYEMRDLEKQWLKYKLKQSIPYFILVIYFILIAVYYNYRVVVNSFILEYYNKIVEKYNIDDNKTVKTKIVDDNESKNLVVTIDKNITTELNRTDDIFDINSTIYEENVTNPFFTTIKSEIKKSPQDKLEDEIEKRHKKKYVYIKTTSREYKEVEKRFKNNQDPEDALFLARFYYESKKYKKAEEWAFIANELDDTSEESWLIYAKAKAKRGKILEAVHILDAYLKKYNSIGARKLLEQYRKKL